MVCAGLLAIFNLKLEAIVNLLGLFKVYSGPLPCTAGWVRTPMTCPIITTLWLEFRMGLKPQDWVSSLASSS